MRLTHRAKLCMVAAYSSLCTARGGGACIIIASVRPSATSVHVQLFYVVIVSRTHGIIIAIKN